MASHNGLAAVDRQWLPFLDVARHLNDFQIPNRDCQRSRRGHTTILKAVYGGPWHRSRKHLSPSQIRPPLRHSTLTPASQIEKVFDVACTLIDVMSCVPLESRKFEPGPQEYLNSLLTLISTLRGGESRFLPLVVAKIRDTLPAIGSQLPQHLIEKYDRLGHQSKRAERPGQHMEFKQENTGESSSAGSSPFETPPFMHYYPLA